MILGTSCILVMSLSSCYVSLFSFLNLTISRRVFSNSLARSSSACLKLAFLSIPISVIFTSPLETGEKSGIAFSYSIPSRFTSSKIFLTSSLFETNVDSPLSPVQMILLEISPCQAIHFLMIAISRLLEMRITIDS